MISRANQGLIKKTELINPLKKCLMLLAHQYNILGSPSKIKTLKANGKMNKYYFRCQRLQFANDKSKPFLNNKFTS